MKSAINITRIRNDSSDTQPAPAERVCELTSTSEYVHTPLKGHPILSLLALLKSYPPSTRMMDSCYSFNLPLPSSRTTKNPRTAKRKGHTTLTLTLRTRSMRFMLATELLSRVATLPSDAMATLPVGDKQTTMLCLSAIALSRTITTGTKTTSLIISDDDPQGSCGGILLRQDLRPSSGSGGVFGIIRRDPRRC